MNIDIFKSIYYPHKSRETEIYVIFIPTTNRRHCDSDWTLKQEVIKYYTELIHLLSRRHIG